MTKFILVAIALLSLTACKKTMTDAQRKEWTDWAQGTCECKGSACKAFNKSPEYPKGGMAAWSEADQAFVSKQERLRQECALRKANEEVARGR